MNDEEKKFITVSELIDKLKAMPEDFPVIVCDGHGNTSPASCVYMDRGVVLLYSGGKLTNEYYDSLPEELNYE